MRLRKASLTNFELKFLWMSKGLMVGFWWSSSHATNLQDHKVRICNRFASISMFEDILHIVVLLEKAKEGNLGVKNDQILTINFPKSKCSLYFMCKEFWWYWHSNVFCKHSLMSEFHHSISNFHFNFGIYFFKKNLESLFISKVLIYQDKHCFSCFFPLMSRSSTNFLIAGTWSEMICGCTYMIHHYIVDSCFDNYFGLTFYLRQ
jgi:hypothetical protein